MTDTEGGPVYTVVYSDPHIAECSCGCGCPELAESEEGFCLACKHGRCVQEE